MATVDVAQPEVSSFESLPTEYYCYQCTSNSSVETLPNGELQCDTCGSGCVEELNDVNDRPLTPIPISRPPFLLENWPGERAIPEWMPIQMPMHRPRTESMSSASSDDSWHLSQPPTLPPREPSITHRQLLDQLSRIIVGSITTPDPPMAEVPPAPSEPPQENLSPFEHRSAQLLTRVRILNRGGDTNGTYDMLAARLLEIMEDVTGPAPARQTAIDDLPTINITKEHTDDECQCSICLEHFDLGATVKALPCDHKYHKECITSWLQRHGTCPVCRKPLEESRHSPQETRVFVAAEMPAPYTPRSYIRREERPSLRRRFSEFMRRTRSFFGRRGRISNS